MLRGKRGLVLIQIVLITIFAFAYVQAKNDNIIQNLNLFGQVLKNVEEKYVEEVDVAKLLEAATEGLLRPLDPYCQFLEADENGKFPTSNQSIFEVSGFALGASSRGPQILAPYMDSEIYLRGVRSGDHIYKINDIVVRNLSLAEIIELIEQSKEDTLKLAIVPAGSRSSINYNFILKEESPKSVPYAFVTPDQIGYIRVSYLEDQTADKIADQLAEFQNQNVQKLILDLRDCPNGKIENAIAVADLFVARGTRISELGGRTSKGGAIYKAAKSANWMQPVVVLTNKGTAGMVEIVVAAITELRKGISVGLATKGKTGFQEILPITADWKIELTTGEYLTAKGDSLLRKVTKDEEGEENVIRKGGVEATVKVSEKLQKRLIRRLNAEKVIDQFVSDKPLLPGDAIDESVQKEFQEFLKEKEFDVEEELIQEEWDEIRFQIEEASLRSKKGNQAAFEFALLHDPLYEESVQIYQDVTSVAQLIEQGRIRAEAKSEEEQK